VFIGIGSIAMAFAASLLDRPYFAAVFTFLGAFAMSIAMMRARNGRYLRSSAHDADRGRPMSRSSHQYPSGRQCPASCRSAPPANAPADVRANAMLSVTLPRCAAALAIAPNAFQGQACARYAPVPLSAN
jgi:hypothetical protein